MKKKRDSLINSIIILAVALVILLTSVVSTTLSWLMPDSYTSSVNSNDFIQISADAGLELNYGDGNNSQGIIDINSKASTAVLHECSSVDGKNFYFPTSDYSSIGDGDFAQGVSSSDLVYRKGSPNDVNKKYISVPFSLSAQSSTDVWLARGSVISTTDSSHTTANAIRVAFVENKIGGKSYVFDNTSTGSVYAEKNMAVAQVNNTGELTKTAKCDTRTFDEFYFDNEAGNVLFHLTGGEELNLTLNIWLEGTDKDCTNAVMNLSDLKIALKFTTSFEDVRTVYFVDNTLEKWVDDDNTYVFAIDGDNVHHQMTKSTTYDSDYTWSVEMGVGIDQLTFARYNPELHGNTPEEWNTWEAGTLGDCSTYVAFGHSAGMWATNFSGTTITLLDGTAKNWVRDANAQMHVLFSAEDGNGVTQQFDYKLSQHHDNNRWQIVIPSNVSAITFKRYSEDLKTVYNTWTDTARGTNLYYTMLDNESGYWSSKMLYVNASSDVFSDSAYLAAYFYNMQGVSGDQWVALHGKHVVGDKTYYMVAVPNNAENVIFCRMNPAGKDTGTPMVWDYVWNQTADLTVGAENAYTITNVKMSGSWSSIAGIS